MYVLKEIGIKPAHAYTPYSIEQWIVIQIQWIFFQLFIYYAHENQTYLLIFEGIFQINHACRLDSHISTFYIYGIYCL